MKLCHSCQNAVTKTTLSPAQFMVWGCKEHKITFGVQSDYEAGKHMRNSCEEYIAICKQK